ncbi:MAG: TipAS antibiotic-recognition domain-containing protein, partial [Spirochaetales bacterium]|nr:TipAS antibiotic-recognition domain-containing protein [Spirochaetales bacterium]
GNAYSFVLSYLGKDELSGLISRFESPEKALKFSDHCNKLFAELFELQSKGVLPESPDGQQFAAKWWKMVQDFTKDDPSLLKSLMGVGLDVENWPDEVADFKEVVSNFLEKALNIYFEKNGVNLFFE